MASPVREGRAFVVKVCGQSIPGCLGPGRREQLEEPLRAADELPVTWGEVQRSPATPGWESRHSPQGLLSAAEVVSLLGVAAPSAGPGWSA